MLKKTQKTTVTRTSNRSSYDRELFNQIIDEAKVGHLAFQDENEIHSIPMLFWRHEDFLYFHCSVGSRLAQLAENNNPVCISFTLLDALVLAKSAFRHSMNYRSAVIYGKVILVENLSSEKLIAFEQLMNLFDKKRWEQARKPNNEEMKATALLKLPIETAVVKVRKGPPNDKAEDRHLNVWAGIVPIRQVYEEPEEYNY